MPAGLLLLAIIIQAVPASPLLLGEIGGQLLPDDIAAIERISQEAGGRLWLIIGQRSQMGRWVAQAFLPPETASDQLRRGRFVTVEAGPSPSLPAQNWKLQSSSMYAQVAIPGREFDKFRDDLDPNLPFDVRGKISDDELVRAVQFIRSGPSGQDVSAAVIGVVHSNWRISMISRSSDGSLYCSLMGTRWSGQGVTLAPSGAKWVVTRIQSWIA